MSDKIKKLHSELLYKNAIQNLQNEISNIEQYVPVKGLSLPKVSGGTFSKAGRFGDDFASGSLKKAGGISDLSKIGKSGLGSGDLSDLSKIGKSGLGGSDLSDLSKLGKSSLGGDLSDLNKLGKSSGDLSDLSSKLGKKFDADKLGDAAKKADVDDLAKRADIDDLAKKADLDDAAKKADAPPSYDSIKKLDADDISKDAAKAAKKNLDDITEGTKDVGTKAGKKVDDLGGDVADAQKQAKKWGSYDDFKKWAAKNKSELIVGGVVLSVGVIAAIALAKFNELNNKEFNITKITTDADTGYIRVEYDPRQTLHEDDSVEITQSNCTPTINGIHKFKDLLDDSSFLIATPDITLEKDGTQGIFKYKTTFGNMFQTVIRDTVSGGIDTVNKGVLQPVIKGAADVTKDTLGSLFNAIIPAKYRTAVYWTLIITAILSVLCSIFLIYKKVKSELDV